MNLYLQECYKTRCYRAGLLAGSELYSNEEQLTMSGVELLNELIWVLEKIILVPNSSDLTFLVLDRRSAFKHPRE